MTNTYNQLFVRFFVGLAVVTLLGCGGMNPSNAFDKGTKYFGRQQYEKAQDAFSMALEKDGMSDLRQAEVYNYLGLIATLQGRVEDAEASFTKALELDAGFFDPSYNLGLAKLEQGDLVGAQSLLEEAASRESKAAYALEWLGHLKLKEGQLADARRMYSEVMSNHGSSPRILSALANVEWVNHKPEDAVTYLMQALEMDPNYPPALFNLARIYDVGFNDTEQARAYYQQYLTVAQDTRRIEFARARVAGRQPDSAVAATPSPERPVPTQPTDAVSKAQLAHMVDALLQRAEERKDSGQMEQALNFCLQAGARSRSVPALREKALRKGTYLCFDMGRAHYELARFLEEQGRNAEALQEYKQAVALESQTKYMHLDLAALASKMEEDDVALSSLRTAAEIDPNDAEVAWSLAEHLDKQGLKDKAAMAYTRFTNQFPQDPRAVKAAARLKTLEPAPVTQISLRSGQVVPPEKAATQGGASAQDSKSALQAYNRGTAYFQKKDLDRAIFFYKRAIELDPYLVRAYYNLGLTYRQKGDLLRAADMFSACIELSPAMVDAYYNSALVLHDLKRDQEAVNALKVLTRKQPDYASAYYLAAVIFSAYPEQTDLARRYYTQFTQLAEPDDPYVPVARQWLAKHP